MSTFPATGIIGKVEVAFGEDPRADSRLWRFTDLTSRWHAAREVTVTAGRSEGAASAEPSEFDIWLDSTDGALMPEDERADYYPNLIEGTPVRWTVDAGWGPSTRFTGFIRSLEPDWPGGSQHQCLVNLKAAGPMARLGKGSPALKSPIRRHYANYGAAAHWPCEDGSASSRAASAVIGVPPMTAVGAIDWASDTGCTGSGPQPVFRPGATMHGTVPAYTHLGTWDVAVLITVPEAVAATAPLLEWTTSGTIRRWLLQLGTGGDLSLHGYDAVGTEVFLTYTYLSTSGSYGRPIAVKLTISQVGPDVSAYLNVYQQDGSVDGAYGSNVASQTLGIVTSVTVAPGGALDGITIGQIAVAPNFLDFTTGVVGGYVGETASDRIQRLCDEEFVNLALVAGDSAALGPQPQGTLLTLLQDAERADGGILSEHNFGFRWQPNSARYNRAVVLEIDAEARQLAKGFRPKRDTQRARNEWEISRVNGSSATYVDEADQARRGAWPDGVTVNVATDGQLLDIAAWLVHIGTAPGMRYPSSGFLLHQSPALILAWQSMIPGDWWRIIRPPQQHPRTPITQLLEGYTETWQGRRSWSVDLRGSPASSYVVFVLDDPVLGLLDTGVLAL